jgi:hypothetical protein
MPQTKNAPTFSGITILKPVARSRRTFLQADPCEFRSRVLKGEMSGTGDDSRVFGPFVNGKSLYYSAFNYDKGSIALNLKKDSDGEISERPADVADVLVENFRPGTMDKLGYGWETLIAILILVIIRFVNRLLNPPPPFPATMARIERSAATPSEYTMYGLMFLFPLVGWGMLSAAHYPIALSGAAHLPYILPHNVRLYAILRESHTIHAYLFFLIFIIN